MKNTTKYGLNKNISYAGIIVATVDERIIEQAQAAIWEGADNIAGDTPIKTEAEHEKFVDATVKALAMEAARQLQAWAECL
jgi:hypothetical protein